MSISVVYWSGTGNTQAMAEAIGEGIESAGAQANVISVDQASVDVLAEEDVIRILWLGRRRMDEKLGRTYDGSRSQDGRTRRRNRK